MKVLFNTHTPFNLAHGGAQIQIERTKDALNQIGVEADFFKWWDENQKPDIIHQIGGVTQAVVQASHRKGCKVVQTLLLTETCNRSSLQLFLRQICVRAVLAAPLPRGMMDQLAWKTYRACDLNIVGLEAERMVLEKLYGIPRERIAVVPLGLTDTFLRAGEAIRTESHLICTGTIGPLKNSIQLARLALEAQVPILFVGKPFDFGNAYWKEFEKLIDGRFVKHQMHVRNEEIVAWLQKARGYVLMSRSENWSLAAHEAAACGLPLLLPDQRWSRERFGNQAVYFPQRLGRRSAIVLRQFYDSCPKLPSPKVELPGWCDVAEKLKRIYSDLLAGKIQG